jgi:hypothetical protein
MDKAPKLGIAGSSPARSSIHYFVLVTLVTIFKFKYQMVAYSSHVGVKLNNFAKCLLSSWSHISVCRFGVFRY